MRLRQACARQMPRALDDLQTLCRLPSVAAQGTAMTATAEAVAAQCRGLGAEVRLLRRAGGFPAVLARWAGPSPRRLLLYNHYDVQPAEPLAAWRSPPFEPEVRDGRLFARGAADNKGDIVCRLAALRALASLGGPPCGVTMLVEGEEEIGSPTLPAHVREAGGDLAADGCLWEFGGRDEAGRPQLYLGVKGLCYLELRARGPASDMHSSMGGIVPNPLWRLVWALGGLKAPDGRVAVAGFYDDVRPPSQAERDAAALLHVDPDALARALGAERLVHEGARDVRDAVLFAPTCNLCGIGGGYQGPGSKTVLPSEAVAKLDLRLVPEQDPERVAELVRRHLRQTGFSDLEVRTLGHERPHRTPPDDPFVAVVAAAARRAYGAEAVIHPTSAGSGPMEVIGRGGTPIVSTGCGYWGAGAHGPNENVRLEDLLAGAVHVAAVMQGLADAG